MREIKFRAWDSFNKIMHYENLSVLQSMAFYAEHQDKFNYNEYMQYTGVKVNRDVELYEGDIVPIKVSVYLGWKQGRYDYKRNAVLKYCQDDMCYKFFAQTPYGLQSVNFDKSIRQSYKVIGNVYENPELLEVIYEAN